MKPILAATALAALSLAACSKSQDPAAVKTDPALTEAAQPDAFATVSSEAGTPSPSTSASSGGADQADKSIPAGMRGRWGVNVADCGPDTGGAKGLMTIDATSVRFYESIAKIAKVEQRSETALKANWAYSGEGMEWKRDMTLALQPGGKVLIKQEFGADAPAGPYKYTRCE